MLDALLPQGGWPASLLIELLLPQPGIGELRLLQHALENLGPRPVVLVQPPCLPPYCRHHPSPLRHQAAAASLQPPVILLP